VIIESTSELDKNEEKELPFYFTTTQSQFKSPEERKDT